MSKYLVTALPFDASDDVVAEFIVTGKDEDDAKENFEKREPQCSILSIKKTQ